FVRSKTAGDESVRDFFVRRVGRQAHDRLVAPALTGIYAGDTATLSMAAVFPKIVQMEREHGSLTRAFLKSFRTRSKPAGVSHPKPKGSVFSFSDGVERLPKRLAEQLRIEYNIVDARIGDAAVTVVAIPAHGAAKVLEKRNKGLATLLEKIQYAPMVIAAITLPDHSFEEPLQGFGFLVPRDQGLHLLGALFSSSLFP